MGVTGVITNRSGRYRERRGVVAKQCNDVCIAWVHEMMGVFIPVVNRELMRFRVHLDSVFDGLFRRRGGLIFGFTLIPRWPQQTPSRFGRCLA